MKKNAQRKKYENQIAALKKWCARKDYTVEIGAFKDEVDTVQKCLRLNNRTRMNNRVYSFLHECGHIVIQSNNKKYTNKYPISGKNARRNNCLLSRIEIIEEEIEAWRVGEKIAEKLNIKLDKKRYRKYAARFLMSYVVSAAMRFNSIYDMI